MATKIYPLQKKVTIDYSGIIISNLWKTKQNITFSQNLRDEILKLIRLSKSVICIQSDFLTDKELVEIILHKAKYNSELKVFVLVNNYSPELEKLASICTIRYELNNMGSFILVNTDSNSPSGLFFAGKLTESSINEFKNVSILPDIQQIRILSNYFSYHFENSAKRELMVSQEKKALDYFKGKDLKSVLFDAGSFFLKELAKEAVKQIIPSSPNKEEQNNNSADYLDKYFVYTIFFDFASTAKRADLVNKIIFLVGNESKPLFVKQNSSVDYGDFRSNVLQSKSEFERKKPDLKDDGVSIFIEYKWKDIPFYLPNHSTEYIYDSSWQNEYKLVIEWIDFVLLQIDDILNREIPNVKRLLLSKKIAIRGMKEDLVTIKYLCNSERKCSQKNIDHINQINQKTLLDIEEIEIESEINYIKAAISEKEQNAVNPANDDILHLKKLLQDKEERKTRILKKQENAKSSTLSDFLNNASELKSDSGGNIPFYHPKSTKVGKLFTNNQQIYLAIEFWEEYEEGKREAERLNAILCAIKN